MKRGKTVFFKLNIAIIGIIVLILCIFWLPWLAKYTAELNPEYSYLRYPMIIAVYTTTIPFYIAIYQSLKLLNYIENKNAFSELAVESLKYIKNCAITIIILYVMIMTFLGVKGFLHPSIVIMGAIIILAASIVAHFATVLQELLRNVLEIKSENDLTI